MVQDLKEIIDHLNTSNSQQDGTDPVSVISYSCTPDMDIKILPWDRKSYLTNAILPRLPCEGFVCLVALRPKSTAMVIAGRSVLLTM